MDKKVKNIIYASILEFIQWLNDFGEKSQDWQDYYASKIGNKAKLLYYKSPVIGTVAVAPMVFCEAFLPSTRRLFWRKQRFPIADAHYSMGYAYLSQAFDRKKSYEKEK